MTRLEDSNSPGIHSHGGSLAPFRYPGNGIRPYFTEQQLAETASWVRHVTAAWGGSNGLHLQGQPDEESKIQLLTWYAGTASREARLVDEFFAANQNRRVEPLAAGSWFRQRNTYGMNTC